MGESRAAPSSIAYLLLISQLSSRASPPNPEADSTPHSSFLLNSQLSTCWTLHLNPLSVPYLSERSHCPNRGLEKEVILVSAAKDNLGYSSYISRFSPNTLVQQNGYLPFLCTSHVFQFPCLCFCSISLKHPTPFTFIIHVKFHCFLKAFPGFYSPVVLSSSF